MERKGLERHSFGMGTAAKLEGAAFFARQAQKT
jgi:hypothetical protein